MGYFCLIQESRKLCTFPMSPSPPCLSKAAALIFLLLVFFSAPCLSDPRTSQAAFICNTNVTATATARTDFIANFQAAMAAITPIIASQRWARVIQGSDNASIVYAFGQCMADLSQSDCDLCFAQCRIQILRCLPFQLTTRSGRNYLDGCYLRYDDYDFYREVLSRSDTTACNATTYAGDRPAFSANVGRLIRNLTAMAPRNGGFYAGSFNAGNATNATAYGLAQCWEYVNQSACRMCLENAASNITSCLPMVEGKSVRSSCYLRYSTYRFYNNSASPTASSSGGGRRRVVIIVAVCSSVAAAGLVIAAAAFFGRRELRRRREERKHLGRLAGVVNKSELNFKYETLERATNYFHSSKKLGQGGSGSVYKGTLSDGREVAIKRLFFNTRQWVDEFFNEVNLVSKIDHKNLVKLLGCSITGPESLLVYEYVPNNSLQHHLFDNRQGQILGWDARCNIILQIAEGLAYLHEGMEERIIHRDIKLSNILLDENLNPKIADFGLARFFPEDKTHISTGIAGTLGYMAPEYLVRGKLTEKADIYSYGVLLLEVICGKRSSVYAHESSPVLQMAWDLYMSNELSEAVDPALEGKFDRQEAIQVLQIGLLCAQASAELRPSMSMVVKMLKGEVPISSPSQPPFLNSNAEAAFLKARYEQRQPHSSSISSGNSMSTTILDPR